ncbi:hypothetical protein AYO41_01635 [Verrucomicrobia bacterium SCGC AG-212-E04]|nr:hypothetical protein AYO41_01635 [Verrucomicrobia bacterium SCGC AG-212-E04]
MGLGAAVLITLSRYLGPENFGILAFAVALVKILSVAATLGLDRIFIANAVKEPNNVPLQFKQLLRLRAVAAVAAYIALLAILMVLRPQDKLTLFACLIVGIALFFQPFDIFDLILQSRGQMRLTVFGKTSAFSLAAASKLVAAFVGAPLLVFAGIDALEPAIAAVTLYFLSKPHSKKDEPPSDTSGSAALLRQGIPQMIASFATILYIRIDQVMLGTMADAKAVGIYTAATQLSEVWLIIPMAVSTGLFPTMIALRHRNEGAFRLCLRGLSQVGAIVAYIIIIVITFLGPWLISLVYGPAFAEANGVLRIHIWSMIFVYLGVLQSVWEITERTLWISAVRSTCGAAINIALNVYLIPRYGAVGAAVATLISYILISTPSLILTLKTRPLFFVQLESLTLLFLIRCFFGTQWGRLRDAVSNAYRTAN